MKASFDSFLRSGGDIALFVLVVAATAFCGWHFKWEAAVWGNVILSLAAAIAFFSLRVARRTERQKATLHFLSAYNDSKVVIEGAGILNKWEKGDEHLSQSEDSEKINFAVREFLNVLEFLAIGLKNGIYDETMIMDAMETAIVRYHQRAAGFIKQARRKDGDVREVAYEHFEGLSNRIQERLKKTA